MECPSLFGESVNVNINVNVIYRVKDDTEQHADVGWLSVATGVGIITHCQTPIMNIKQPTGNVTFLCLRSICRNGGYIFCLK